MTIEWVEALFAAVFLLIIIFCVYLDLSSDNFNPTGLRREFELDEEIKKEGGEW